MLIIRRSYGLDDIQTVQDDLIFYPVLVDHGGEVSKPRNHGIAVEQSDVGTMAVAGSAFVINVSYDASVANAPAAFKSAIQSVVQFYESRFTDPVTINIAVGYQEVGGSSLDSGALGESLSFLSNYSYSQVKNALTQDAKSSDDTASAATLPLLSPVAGDYWLSTAEAKALGLAAASASLDGYIGFASGNLFDFNTSDGITAGKYDFFGAAAHEFSEVMGRMLLVGEPLGGSAHAYDALDLFHYSAPGLRDFVGTTPGYFSFDAGVSNLNDFNTNPNGDFGDWAASAGPDSYLAFISSGVVNPVTTNDLRAVDVTGWDGVQASPQLPLVTPDLTVDGLTLDGVNASVSFTVHNIGTGAADASATGIYLSADASITTADILIASASTPPLGAGQSDSESAALAFPTNLTPGIYNLGALADSGGTVSESNESNNNSNVISVLLGNGSGNKLTATSAAHTILGLGGNDTLTGGPGGDAMYGGAGNDTYFVNNSVDSVGERANDGTDIVQTTVSFTLSANVENLTLRGKVAIDGTGNDQNNTITGNSAANTIAGKFGNDRLTGGDGSDNFLFDTALDGVANVDTIADFKSGQSDRIELDHAVFAAVMPLSDGTLAPSAFDANASGTAQTPDDRILYNTKTGALFYDPDGTGAAAATQFATVNNHPTLTAHDFLIV